MGWRQLEESKAVTGKRRRSGENYFKTATGG